MDAEIASNLRHLPLRSSPPASQISLRLKEALEASSSLIETEGVIQSDDIVAPLISFMNSLLEPSTSDSDEAHIDIECSEVALYEIYRFIISPDSNQMVNEALSLELPKLIIKFAHLSVKCREIAGRIVEHLVSACKPREMLSVLCEALSFYTNAFGALGCCSHFLFGLSKVLLSVQRRHVEQAKVVLPVILGVLNVATSEIDEEDEDSLNDLLSAAISIGSSIQEICQKLEDQRKEVLCAVLGLYVLQSIAFISRVQQKHILESSCSFVAKFSQFLPFCGISYFGLLTGALDKIKEKIKDDDDDFMACFSSSACGASLAVIWGYISDDVKIATGERLDNVASEIQRDRFRRWQALDMFKRILISIDYSWVIKSHCIDVLLSMIDGVTFEEHNGCDDDLSSFLPYLFTSLMAIEKIVMGAPDPSLRKKALGVLRMVISDIPSCQRFDILKALITNTDSPSMVAILIDIARGEVLVDTTQETSRKEQKKKELSKFWGFKALDIVEMVLRPPKGGPPSLPEHSEPVLSALNLYRFIMIIELTGKTNHTGVMCEDSLRKAYSEWLMPLRTLVSGILVENQNDGTELSESIACALSPVQVVLYRCIELVEESLKQ